MKPNTDPFKMIFHTLVVGCNNFHVNKITTIGKMYNHHISSTSLIQLSSRKHFFHAFLISQNTPNYLDSIKKIKLEFPNSIFVILVEDPSTIQPLIDSKELFFILNKDHLDFSYHQLCQWLLLLETKKFGFQNETNQISIAGGVLSLVEETYTRIDKTHQLTKKQMDLLKILLEYRGEPVSRDILIKRIWITKQKVVTDRVIDTNIVALRKMFGDNGKSPKYLQTIFGQGYKLILE